MKHLLSLSLLIAGFLLCINVRTLRSVQQINDFFYECGGTQGSKVFRCQLDRLELSPADRAFLDEFLSGRTDFEWYRKMHETDPEDMGFLAAALLLSEDSGEKLTLPLIEEFRRRDPENALPDYVEACLLYPQALVVKSKETQDEKIHPVCTIRDRAQLERMASLFMAGIRKPYCRSYAEVLPERAIRLLNLKDDPFDHFFKMGIRSGVLTPHLAILRRVTESALFYAETLEKEGKHEEAAAILHSGPALILQQIRQDQKTLIEPIVYYALNSFFLRSAKAMKDEAAIRLYQKPEDFFIVWKKAESDVDETIRQYGGFCSRMMIPTVLREPFRITEEELEPERTITFLALDQLALAGFALLILLLWIILALIALFKRSGAVPFTRKDCLYMIGYSLLTPLAFALLWSGRFCMIRDLRLRLVIAAGMLLALTVPLFMSVYRKTRRNPSASFARTMLLPLALCLFLTGAILRPLLDHRIRSCWQREPLFRPAVSYSTAEDRMRNYLIDNLTAFLQEKQP